MNKRKISQIKFLYLFILLLLIASSCREQYKFSSAWPEKVKRVWIGPEYWANPLQDWQLNEGRIECISSGGDRNVFLLTRELSANQGDVNMQVSLGRLGHAPESLEEGWVGFKVGVRGEFDHYKDSAIRGQGLRVGMTTAGKLFIQNVSDSVPEIKTNFQDITLAFNARPKGDKYIVSLTAKDKDENVLAQLVDRDTDADWLQGGIALVCSRGKITPIPAKRLGVDYAEWGSTPGTERGGNVRFWFADWHISGSKIRIAENRIFGPILFSQYTLSNGILKLSAQLAPVGKQDGKTVSFFIRDDRNEWILVDKTPVDTLSLTATFRIENWDYTRDIPFRLQYNLAIGNNEFLTYLKEGLIRHEPWEKNEVLVAGFTGNNDLGFPNTELVQAVKYHDPDILFFSGDQIYEGVAGYGVQRSPLKQASLDYLRKWYLYGWAYGDLLADHPAIAIPDDHDVYHGNLWGAGGIATPEGMQGIEAQDHGGYKMPAAWVNMVQRTQTSHLPDPFDATPVEQGIGVYYCQLNYAGISFAILEDRKFKSAPKKLLPKARVRNGWAQNPDFNAELEADISGAVLLGERQLYFLHQWAQDWSANTWMKVVLSQTIFSNVATLPEEEANSDRIVPRLRILEPGDYPPNDIPVADMDSDGWPPSGRNRALRAMRSCFAFHLAGDQHLGSTIQYGIDEWHDASFAFCVPAISNVWPRRWFPMNPGKNRLPGAPKYTGDFKDGFGNIMTVYAISNPYYTGKKPSRLYDRATGYGIVRFNRKTRDITIECWPRWVDPSRSDAKQYPGWPIRCNQLDNYNRKAIAWLPIIKMKASLNPVIQIISESNGQTVYSLRIEGNSYQPKVFKHGYYTIRISSPETGKLKDITGVLASDSKQREILEIDF